MPRPIASSPSAFGSRSPARRSARRRASSSSRRARHLEPTSSSQSSRARITRLVLILYLVGILIDLAWHVRFYLTTGDRAIEGYEWIIGLQASLFWPLDLLAQAMLALR